VTEMMNPLLVATSDYEKEQLKRWAFRRFLKTVKLRRRRCDVLQQSFPQSESGDRKIC